MVSPHVLRKSQFVIGKKKQAQKCQNYTLENNAPEKDGKNMCHSAQAFVTNLTFDTCHLRSCFHLSREY